MGRAPWPSDIEHCFEDRDRGLFFSVMAKWFNKILICLIPARTHRCALLTGELTRFCMNTLTRKDSVLFSFIDGFNVSNAYIAAQGPLNINNELFWQFAWKQGVAAIVVLSSQTNVRQSQLFRTFLYPQKGLKCQCRVRLNLVR